MDGAEVVAGTVFSFYPLVKAGKLRLLAVMDKQESSMAPGVKTAEAQGFKVYGAAARGIYVPAGTPKEVVDVLANTVKKITSDPAYQSKMLEMGHIVRYMGPEETDKYWSDLEASMKPLIEQAIAESK
ncbi:MAG TPA: tripartite tricarboxylate transporter substrate-binding protein [Chloroflexota bacterium]|nr:tripartite tricarboxylate transporter substrate-binding protein [Chloroflexota bacterium]